MPKFLEPFLPRSQSRAIYAFTMACYDITFTVLGIQLAGVLGLWNVRTQTYAERIEQMSVLNQTVIDLLISPIVESLMLIGIIELLRWRGFRDIIGITLATVLICLLHTVIGPIWGLISVPGFFIGTASYVYWRRVSFWAGFQMIVVLHVCSNILPVLDLIERNL